MGFRIVPIVHCTSRQEKVIWELTHDQQGTLLHRVRSLAVQSQIE